MSRSNTDAVSIVHLAAVALLLGAVLAALPASGQYGGYFGKNRIQYRDFDWHIYHSPHFDVYYYTVEEHQLQTAVSLAESAYDELSRRFDYQIQEPTPLIIYQTHSAFLQNNIIVYGVPEGAQAFASPVRFRMVLPLDMDDASLLKLIRHELTHIFQYHILFRGRLGAGLRGAPPQWFIEGGASYFGNDEDAADRKYMIDMVVNDRIPSVEVQGGGFLAYRFGHAIFDFIEERWGQEAILDLFYEFRNTLGSRVGRAIERTFRMDVEDFDAEFRRWARQKYLPELLETGEPGDFGKPFRLEPGRDGWEMSPAASPSGDLLAAVTTDRQEVDISLFDTQKRRRIKVLTQGLDTQIQWILAQQATFGRFVGRDLSFSPDGNYLAAFARREEGYALILIDVLNGGLHKIIAMDVEQQLAPAWSPDGRFIAFSGNLNGQFDIFVIDLETLEITNLTNDEIPDAGPVYSPDGRTLAYSAVVGEHHQIFTIDLADPSRRFQVTHAAANSKEPIFSRDGKRVYFASDRGGAVDNIYGYDFERQELRQYTNSLTGCDQPTVLPLPEGGERLVYTGYWKGRFDLYTTDVEEPVSEPEKIAFDPRPVQMAELERFEPDIEVAIDEDNIEGYGGKKFFIEDIQQFVGLDSNQVFRGQVIVSMSDYLGDRRIVGVLAADDIFSDFDIAYFNLKNRWQWSGRLFNTKYVTYQFDPGDFRYERRTAFSLTGAEYARIYPFNRKNRVEFTGGYYYRDYRFNYNVRDPVSGQVINVISPRTDAYPTLSTAFVSDSTIFNQWGPLNGHRLRISTSWAPDFDESGTLFWDASLDARKYIAAGRRANLAFRLVAFTSDGNFPNINFVGGLDTVRGYQFREFGGFRGFFGNAEFRFPLIDQLRFPGFALNGIRGVIFLDVGGTWFPEIADFDFYSDGRLQDAVAAFGFGVTVNLFGLDLNWDFARLTDFDHSGDSYETAFWIGRRF